MQAAEKFNSRIITTLLLGFSSGLPLALTGSTLQAWFTQSSVNLVMIGTLSLIGLPYVWKFLWAPVMDRFVPPLLGRRRGWILFTQMGLCIALFFLSQMHPQAEPKLIGILALFIAFLSASQDIAVDAYRADILLPSERGLGSAAFIFAYRIAMLTSAGMALILADRFGWRATYEFMAVLIGLSTLVSFFGPEPAFSPKKPSNFVTAIYEPFLDLMNRDQIILILLFVIFYKLGDAFALTLMSNFLLHGLGFSLTDVGLVFKTLGLLATILGAFLGGTLLIRMNIYWALWIFGLMQAFSNLMFMLLAAVGKSYMLMTASLFIESFCSGMSTAALMAFMMSLCNPAYSATQYASLSALSAIGRVFLGPIAAITVEHIGWINFYFWSFFLCFPGILLINLMWNRVKFNAEPIEN